MSKKIIYIHGFATTGEGVKVDLLRKNIDCEVMSPTFVFNPEKTIDSLEKIINKDTILVGTSLGGFYAWYLACKHNLKAIIVNPSPRPGYTIEQKLNGQQMVVWNNLVTGEPFEITKKHSDFLKKMTKETLMKQINYPNKDIEERYIGMFLAKNDSILNYFTALELIDSSDVFITETGEHSYLENWDLVIAATKKLL